MTRRGLAVSGFAVLRNVYSAAAIATLRAEAERSQRRMIDDILPSRQFYKSAILSCAQVELEAVGALEGLLGPDVVVHANGDVKKNSFVDWHIDKSYRAAQRESAAFTEYSCAVYLQDNTVNGGGLDVIAGSHYDRDGAATPRVVRELAHDERPCEVLAPTTIESRAGDVVVWDARIVHRATQRRVETVSSKLALHWTVSVDAAAARARLAVLRASANARLADTARLRFPDDFTAEFQRLVAQRRHGRLFAAFDRDGAG